MRPTILWEPTCHRVIACSVLFEQCNGCRSSAGQLRSRLVPTRNRETPPPHDLTKGAHPARATQILSWLQTLLPEQ
jgi:hypothetical protein